MPIPIAAEANQYRANPLGKDRVKKPNIMGIIHNIVLVVDSVRGSPVGIEVIFCWTHMEAPTSTGITIFVGSGTPRSSHKKSLFRGTALFTKGSQEYRCWESRAIASGVVGRREIMA